VLEKHIREEIKISNSTNLKTWVVMPIFLLTLAVLSANTFATGTYDDGDGSQGNPFQINTPAQMDEIGQHPEDWDKCFILTADIDLSGYTGTAFHIIGTDYDNPFTGVFDGNDHTISNFTYSSTGVSFIGLFGYVGSGEIKNLGLQNVNVDGGTGWNVGGLVGLNEYGTVSNCYATGNVSGDKRVGGLLGLNYYDSTVSNCYAAGTVSGVSWVGGLVGINHFGTVSICYAAGNVFGSGSVGGLVGYNNYGTISKCYATGTVSGDILVGGLVGYRYYGTVSNCYASGTVTGGSEVGGLVGWNNSTISNCYATGSVSGSSIVGGLVGYDYFGTVTASFWDIDTSGQAISAGGAGKTTVQMQTQSTFTDAGWNFVEIWGIGENQTYPYLRVYPASDLNHDSRVDFLDFAIFANHWLQVSNSFTTSLR